VWAIARRLYVRAAIGLIAWIAIAHQSFQLYSDGTPDLMLLLSATVLLVAMLHLTAGEYGQRWVVYKLQRSIAVADRRRIFEPQQRADFLRQRGTRSQSLQEARPRNQRRASYQSWWKWLLFFVIMSAIFRLFEALVRFIPLPGP